VIDIDKITGSPFLIGAAGAAVTALHFTPGASWWERMANVGAGSVVAGFLSPALIRWLELTEPAYASAGAFLCGLLGMSLMAAALEFIRSGGLREALSAWLSKRP
jgi:hypothetical protein